MTNKSFLVANNKFEAVIRINAANSEQFGIDRQREASIVRALSATGCVPELFFFSQDTQVARYIRGRPLRPTDLAVEDVRVNLSNCLQRIQQVKLTGQPRNYMQYSRLYSDQLADFCDREKIETAAQIVDRADWQPVICHHDLILENIICSDQGLYFIDWEYAALGHPQLDAVWLFGKQPLVDNTNQAVIDALVTLQWGLEKLWYAVRERRQKNAGEYLGL